MSLISDIADVSGKFVQRFLTLDDLVAGQGVVNGGLGQVKNAGRLGAGSVLATSNLAARTVQLGVQAGAKTAAATAGVLDGVVPGADAAVRLAEKVDAQATSAAEQASLLATHSVQMTGGPDSAPLNPIFGDRWLGKMVPAGYSWYDLTADTVTGSLGSIAFLPVTVGLDTAGAALGSGPGQMALGTAMRAVNGALDMVSTKSDLDNAELRDALMAVSGSTGRAVVRDIATIAEAASRFAFGDTRAILRGMNDGLEEMRLLAARRDVDELLPALPIHSLLRQRAQKIVDNPPKAFLAAISHQPSQVGEVFKALIEDAGPLRVFLINYPQVITLLGANTGLVLAAGLLDVGEIEGFVRQDSERGAPWSAIGFEDYVGQAVLDKADPDAGYYTEPAVHLAQDVSFLYTTDVLGRDKALARSERLYGKAARRRVESDLSLDLDVLRGDSAAARQEKVRAHLAKAGDIHKLSRIRDQSEAQLESLSAFSRGRLQYVPAQVHTRIEVLEFCLSQVHQEIALLSLDEDAPESGGLAAAQSAFSAWVYGAADDGDSGGDAKIEKSAATPSPVPTSPGPKTVSAPGKSESNA